MNCGSASSSSVSALGRRAGTVGALWQQASAVAPGSIAFGALGNICSAAPSPASVGALRHQEGFLCAHVLRRSREPVGVTRSANSMRVAPVLLQPPAGRTVGLSSTHPVRLARWRAIAAVGAFAGHHCHRRCSCKAPAHGVARAMPPNMSVNRTRYGMAPWPRCARCHCCASRPGRHACARRLPLR
jgi:hypothetical protein